MPPLSELDSTILAMLKRDFPVFVTVFGGSYIERWVTAKEGSRANWKVSLAIESSSLADLPAIDRYHNPSGKWDAYLAGDDHLYVFFKEYSNVVAELKLKFGWHGGRDEKCND